MAEAERSVPRHVAIIMDGNGRWAKKRLLPRAMGHRAGLRRMISLIGHIFSRGVEYCTLFALSAENFARPAEEIEALFSLFREYFTQNVAELEAQGIRLIVIGDRSLLPADIQGAISHAEEATGRGARGTLALAIGYGARQDLVCACNKFVREGREATQETLAQSLSTGTMPEVDLLIRTGKEKRLSNFLLFEAAYAELIFSEKLFPDFTDRDFDGALAEYAKRERRFGKL